MLNVEDDDDEGDHDEGDDNKDAQHDKKNR